MPSPAVIHVAVQPVSYTEYKRIGVRAVQCRSATGSAAVRAVLSIYPSFCFVVCLYFCWSVSISLIILVSVLWKVGLIRVLDIDLISYCF